MNPAWSIVLFTTLAGSAQGLVVALAVATLAGLPLDRGFLSDALALAAILLVVSLVSSFFHLGHPMRAWRAALMWRTSWMSREVIVLPLFIGLVALWALLAAARPDIAASPLLAVASLVLAALLWWCTAMIYACLRFIQEWAHPLTLINYTLIGLSGGLVLAGAVGALAGQAAFVDAVGPWALVVTLLAWGTRWLSLQRNARLVPRSTLQSATGIVAGRLVQTSMGMTGGSFNTREFRHRATLAVMRRMRTGFQWLGFALPALLVAWALAGNGGTAAWLLALLLQTAGLLAERWFFFAQARHPQNLYYQVVS